MTKDKPKRSFVKVKLFVEPGKANPAPPIGTTLGPRGINIMNFCKQFNEESKKLPFPEGLKVAVSIRIFDDKSFDFTIGTPPATELIKKYCNISKGSSATKKDANIGDISLEVCKEIAKIKLVDLNTDDIDQAIKTIMGSAESMGLRIVK